MKIMPFSGCYILRRSVTKHSPHCKNVTASLLIHSKKNFFGTHGGWVKIKVKFIKIFVSPWILIFTSLKSEFLIHSASWLYFPTLVSQEKSEISRLGNCHFVVSTSHDYVESSLLWLQYIGRSSWNRNNCRDAFMSRPWIWNYSLSTILFEDYPLSPNIYSIFRLFLHLNLYWRRISLQS